MPQWAEMCSFVDDNSLFLAHCIPSLSVEWVEGLEQCSTVLPYCGLVFGLSG